MRVERLLNVMATVLPEREVEREWRSWRPDLRVCLWVWALRIRVVSSAVVRSAMERRWRGAKGEVGGEGEGGGVE